MRARLAAAAAAIAAAAAACRGAPARPDDEPASRPAAAPAPDAAPAAPPDAAPPDAAPPDAAPPATLDDALAALRAAGLDAAADAIARRAAQTRPKLRLSAAEAHAAALAVLELASAGPLRDLHAVMPRSTVELARAVRERGVPRADAEAIARYLVGLVAALDFERLHVFDENHAHVTGRDWPEIDYTGEGMTWQGQRDYWSPRGVPHFRTAAAIHAYVTGAEKLPHWQRVYRPRGRVADAPPP